MHVRSPSRPIRHRLCRIAATVGLALTPFVASAQELPRTGAEKVNFSRTTNHQEVIDFLFEIQARTDRMLVRHLTTTDEGRMVPIVMLGTPPTATPGSAFFSGKPLLFITGSVHGGEVAGKEGALQLIRELTLGEHRALLEQVNVLVVPSLNPDGAESRRRTNSKGYDMNRDFVTLETPEIKAMVEDVLLEWWPDVYVDAHNGGSFPYNLTYQATLHPSADQELVAYARGPMYRAVEAHLKAHGMQSYWYSGPRQNAQTQEWSWGTTEPWLRKQHSYGGFQNVVTLLYEAPGGHPLELQAKAQREGYVGLMKFMAANAAQLRGVVTGARKRTIERKVAVIGMDPQASAYPVKEQFYVMAGRDSANPRGVATLVTGVNRTLYVPSKTRARPWAYVFDAKLDSVAGHLRRHGVEVEKLQAPLTVPVERYHLTAVTQAAQPYQSHRMREATVAVSSQTMTVPAGSYLVRTGQNAGMVAALLLEPDNEDSLLSWNFLDHVLPAPDPAGRSPASVLPIYRIVQPVTGVRSLLIP